VGNVKTEKLLDAIYKAKIVGKSDGTIMKEFSVSLKDIEAAIVRKTGANLNVYSTRKMLTSVTPSRFTPERSTIWSFPSRGRWATHNGNYRGNWSPYIPRNIILRHSHPGDLVLDQFSGGGTTAIEAKLLGRRCVALDINPSAVAITRESLNFTASIQELLDETRINLPLHEPETAVGNASRLEGIEDQSIDLICTHPPYANIVRYSDALEGDISHHDVDEFLEDMHLVAQECFRVLKPGRMCAILIGDTRRKKHVVPIGFRTINAFLKQGFLLNELVIKRQHNCRTTGFWYTSSLKYNFLLLAQEYLPIFIKPDNEHGQAAAKTSQQIGLKITTSEIPDPPDIVECKTTWVFPSAERNSLCHSNVLNRYGKGGRVLTVDVEAFSSDTATVMPNRLIDLMYIRSPALDAGAISLEKYLSTIGDLTSHADGLVKQEGYLVIRTRDIRRNGLTECPALTILEMPSDRFRIREIIVVTDDMSGDIKQSTDELSISHEYLLVYQKHE
jgi:DNA modification methylase